MRALTSPLGWRSQRILASTGAGVTAAMMALTGVAGRQKLGVLPTRTGVAVLARRLGELDTSSDPSPCSNCGGCDDRAARGGRGACGAHSARRGRDARAARRRRRRALEVEGCAAAPLFFLGAIGDVEDDEDLHASCIRFIQVASPYLACQRGRGGA